MGTRNGAAEGRRARAAGRVEDRAHRHAGAKAREGHAGDARVQQKKLQGFYRGLAEMLGRHSGWTAILLSGSPLLERAIPLRAEIDHRLWNGPLEVHLLRYRIP